MSCEDTSGSMQTSIDVIYTPTLIRAQMTAMFAMTQHRRKKVFVCFIISFNYVILDNFTLDRDMNIQAFNEKGKFYFQVPIIMHNESEQAKAWREVYSEDTK